MTTEDFVIGFGAGGVVGAVVVAVYGPAHALAGLGFAIGYWGKCLWDANVRNRP